MSFILDALKKSESERHRHSGPVLMDVRIAPPRRRLPVWAWVIAGVLLVNLLLLVWVLWLSPDRRAAAAASAAVAPGTAPPVVAPPAVTPPAMAPAAPQTAAPQVAAPVVSTAPPPEALPPAASTVPPPTAAGPPPANAPAIDVTTLPRVQDLVASGTALPELRLSLHVFDASPANRYVLLNGMRLREGESTSDGVKVVQIAPAGVVLEWRGRRMFLGAAG